MLILTSAQIKLFERGQRQAFIQRVANHLAVLASTHHDAAHIHLAEYALAQREAFSSANEDEVVVLAEIFLKMGGDRPPLPSWAQEILIDSRPEKARRMRECWAVVARIQSSQQHLGGRYSHG